MTNQSELDKRLEDILRHIDDEKADGHWITADTAKDKIKQLIADEVEKLIGEDDTGIITDPDSVDYGQPYSNVYVDRDEQRKILAQHGYKGEDDE